MSTHNICFRGEIRKCQYFWNEKKPSYQELCKLRFLYRQDNQVQELLESKNNLASILVC